MHSEGYTTYPKYGELYDRQVKNVSEVQHLLKAPGQQMASADWQLSMRYLLIKDFHRS